jgi:hypothetical protein
MPPRPAAKSGASGSSRRPHAARADRAVLLVHPVRHRGEHLGRLVVAGRQLDVVRLRDGPEVELVDFVGGDPHREAYQTVAALGRQRLDRDELAAAASDRASAMTATIANMTCGEMLD